MNTYHYRLSPLCALVLMAFLVFPSGCNDKRAASDGGKVSTGDSQRNRGAGKTGGDRAKPVKVSLTGVTKRIRLFLKAWEKNETEFLVNYEANFKTQLKQQKAFAKLSSQAYEKKDYRPIFTDGTGLNDAGKALLETLKGLESHGLDPKGYKMDTILTELAHLNKLAENYKSRQIAPKTAKERTLWRVLKKLHGDKITGLEAIEERLKATGINDKDIPVVDAAQTSLEGIFTAKKDLNRIAVAIDIKMLGAFFRNLYDMRYALIAHPFDADKSYWHGVKRKKDTLFTHYVETDFTQLKEALHALNPGNPEYAAMQTGLVFYRKLAKDVQQVKLPKSAARLKLKRKGEGVKALQTRLQQEEYYDGPNDGVFDDDVAAAVLLYQQTHQLKETGRMDRSTRRSMNRTFATRARQVALGLQRHRESELHQGEWRFGAEDVPVRARVNIAAFEAEFYQGKKLARKHRIVVGNNRPSVHENTGHRGWFNRTRLFTREMITVVLNPTWRVPRRIKEQELDRELLTQPDYYEKNNYKVRILDNGTEEVIQLPGPGNALGQVKFLFPNRFSIYLHDTPRKHLFNRTIRAFSHGCMRLKDPLKLARWILVTLEGRKDAWMDRVLAKREVYGVALKNRIPVTMEYNTIGVHSSGRMMFYLDVYGFDRDYLRGKTPYPKLVGRGLEQVVLLEKKGK